MPPMTMPPKTLVSSVSWPRTVAVSIAARLGDDADGPVHHEVADRGGQRCHAVVLGQAQGDPDREDQWQRSEDRVSGALEDLQEHIHRLGDDARGDRVTDGLLDVAAGGHPVDGADPMFLARCWNPPMKAPPTPSRMPATGRTETGSISDFPIFCRNPNARLKRLAFAGAAGAVAVVMTRSPSRTERAEPAESSSWSAGTSARTAAAESRARARAANSWHRARDRDRIWALTAGIAGMLTLSSSTPSPTRIGTA